MLKKVASDYAQSTLPGFNTDLGLCPVGTSFQ